MGQENEHHRRKKSRDVIPLVKSVIFVKADIAILVSKSCIFLRSWPTRLVQEWLILYFLTTENIPPKPCAKYWFQTQYLVEINSWIWPGKRNLNIPKNHLKIIIVINSQIIFLASSVTLALARIQLLFNWKFYFDSSWYVFFTRSVKPLLYF